MLFLKIKSVVSVWLIEKKDDFKGSKEQWKRVQKLKGRLDNIDENINQLEIAVIRTNEVIEEFRNNSPNLFKLIDGITNEAGEEVDFMLGTKDFFDSKKASGSSSGIQGGYNEVPEFKIGEDGVMRVYSLEFGKNTVAIFVESHKKDREWYISTFNQNIINHEAGHFEVIAKYTREYKNYLDSLKKEGRKLNGGHNTDDKSGQKAEEYGKVKDIEKD